MANMLSFICYQKRCKSNAIWLIAAAITLMPRWNTSTADNAIGLIRLFPPDALIATAYQQQCQENFMKKKIGIFQFRHLLERLEDPVHVFMLQQ